MAGESPDKSEKQKSSGGTASSERDPRLAVLGDAPSPAGGRDEDRDEAGGAARDQAADEAADEAGDRPGAGAGTGTRELRTDQPTAVFRAVTPPAGEDDSRLREAVAAWVADEDDKAAADAARVEPGGSGTSEESGESVRPAQAERPGTSEEVAKAPATTGTTGITRGKAPGDAGRPGDSGDSGATADTADPAGARDKKTVADDEAPAKPAEDAAVSAPAVAEAPAVADARAEQDAPAEASAPAEAEAPAKGDAPAEASAPAEPGAPTEPGVPATVDAPTTAATPAQGETATPAQGKTGTPAEPEAAEDEDDAATAPAVDQPTAVFRAVQRTGPVDQPTTALKAVTPAPAAKPAGGPAPESAAERTSTFVPLRDDDVRPAGRRPEAKPETKPESGAGAGTGTAPEAASAAAASATPETAPASLTEAERTKQQPMPPLPPLDLLAELTNTPPPPETPVRTALRRVKIWTPLVVLLLIVFAVVQTVRPLPTPELTLSAAPTYTFEGGRLKMPWPGEGQGAVEMEGVGSIGTYGAQKPAPIASVAKTMTAYVILKHHPISGKQTGPKITVDKKAEEEASAEDESTARIKEGQQYTQKQMLQLLMIPSGNNAARLLARWDAKTEEAFVKKMNDAAKALGMTNTKYTDPSGLKASTVSTPTDQVKLGKAVMQNDIFRDIVNTPNITIPGIDKRIENNNTILLEPGVGGIKTGSSTPAGGNLLWSANVEVDGKLRRVIGMVMGAQNAGTLHEKLQLAVNKYSLDLIKAAQEGVTSATVVKKGDVVGHVDDGLGGRTPVVATKDMRPVGWPGLAVDVRLGDGGKPVPHSAKAGTVVGEVSVGTGTGEVSVPVALQRDLAEPGFGDKLTRLG
ncbi:serine hydrolase [Streptomyces sp. HMX112]|uniref:serine hydrolase n=1 Tax=Streptomyces sp. HMX112 TaxID=3390850 RepID=UPI003A7FF5CD